tara:strand:+ start:209 stop:505 length:297 start_codon:yes stop_codon:yes gene_type:complete
LAIVIAIAIIITTAIAVAVTAARAGSIAVSVSGPIAVPAFAETKGAVLAGGAVSVRGATVFFFALLFGVVYAYAVDTNLVATGAIVNALSVQRDAKTV